MPTPGTLQHLLVIADPDAGTPYDPASTALPSDEHEWYTSERRLHHPWIAAVNPGDPNSGPDIQIGGQRLELPLGRSIDAECQVRVIDEPAPIATITCGANILLAEGNNLIDGDTLFADGWEIRGDTQGLGYQFTRPASPTPTEYGGGGWWSNAAGTLQLGGSALFFWVDFNPPINGQYSFPPWVRTTWAQRTFDGTELGGSAWTPGQHVGVHFRANWSLDSGDGNLFAEANGNRVSFPNGAYDFWDIDEALAPFWVFDGYLYCQADANGEVLLKLGGENYAPSCNVTATFQDLEFVTCEPVVVAVDTERYTTASHADDAARQKQLGRPYYLKTSRDGGLTYDELVYAGYLKQRTMELALTYLLVGGDAGRGRRVSKAWRALNPLADFQSFP